MKIAYHAPFTINEYLKDLVEEKLEKLEELNLRHADVDVYFKLKDGHQPNPLEDKEVEIKFHVPGHVLFAKSFSDTYEKAIPMAIGKIRKQIIKYKKSIEPKRTPKVS